MSWGTGPRHASCLGFCGLLCFDLMADGGEGGAGGDHFRVHCELDDGGALAGGGFFEGGCELLGAGRSCRRVERSATRCW